MIQDGVQKGLPEYVYAQTNWQRNEKFSIRSKDTRYVYSYDAWLFQKEKNVEGKLPLLEETRKLLSGPIHELYTTSCTPLSFCWGDTSLKESWRTNAYSEHQHQSLEKRLQEWNAQVKKRIPEQRAEDDGISVFRIEGENMIEERFVPHEWAEISPEMTPSMREQLKNLGYLDE